LPRRVDPPRLSALPGGRAAAAVSPERQEASAQAVVRADAPARVAGVGSRRASQGSNVIATEAVNATPAPSDAVASFSQRLAKSGERPSSGQASPRKARLAFAGALPPARIPPESLAAPRRLSTFGIAIAISLALHAVAMTLHFTIGSGRLNDNGPPLVVALVNAKSASKPVKPDILAQANLDGGGNTEKDRRAKTPLPVAPRETPRQNVQAAAERTKVLENTTREMMTQLASPVAVPMPEPKPLDESEKTDSPTANDLMQKTLEAVRLEAQIARDLDAYQKIPRRTHIGAQAKEYRFARYVEDWRMKVERIGNLNYPEAARQKKLYGSLVLTVFIRADGSVEKVEVNRKSGQRILDAAAVKIVEMAGPYAPFPDDIRRDTDILGITRTWTFARGDELHSD
jgi:protein TonB